MEDMEKGILTFLGNDSGFGEKNNSAYFEKDNQLFIIDCGFTVFNEIKNKFDFNSYSNINVIITHLHNDHAGSLSQFILYMWFVYKKQVNVICNCKYIKEYLNITGTPKCAYNLKNKLDNLTFIEIKHTDNLDAYGFIMDINGTKILYTGDSCEITSFLPYIHNIDELYIDLSKFGGAHIKVDDVLTELKELKKRNITIIPMHMDDKKYIMAIVSQL